MSGGEWDYKQHVMQELLEKVSNNKEVKFRFPILARVLGNLGEILFDIVNSLDKHISGDTELTEEWENDILEKLETLYDDPYILGYDRGRRDSSELEEPNYGSNNNPDYIKGYNNGFYGMEEEE